MTRLLDNHKRNCEIKHLNQQGYSNEQIARKFGLKPGAVFYILNYGYEEEKAKWRREEEMIRLYVEDGLSFAEIGDKYGVSKQAVAKRLKNAGVESRPKGRRPKEQNHGS